MAADDAEEIDGEDEDFDEGDLTDGLEAKKFSGKKIILIVAGVLLIGGLGIGGYMFFAGSGEDRLAEGEEAILAPVAFFDLPEMLISINNNGRVGYLKVQASLEMEEESSRARIEELLPRIVDNFQIYLRELRAEDIDGSAGMFRLKEELLRRVNVAVAPVLINDVLFRELLIQ